MKPKSKESIKEAVDIIRNSKDDDAAIEFLRETLEDDFPDLELGSMDLHEAIEVLGGSEQSKEGGDLSAVGDLSKALGEFMSKKDVASKGVKKKKRRRRKRKKKS